MAIDEASFGPDHPLVAIHLNNLAGLLRQTNRLSEAEPLFRRALAIDEMSYGPDHPTVAKDLDGLASLLHDTNRLSDLAAEHVELRVGSSIATAGPMSTISARNVTSAIGGA